MPMSELGGLILLDVNFFLNFILPVFLPCVRHAWKKGLTESVISKGWSPTGFLMVLAVVKYGISFVCNSSLKTECLKLWV